MDTTSAEKLEGNVRFVDDSNRLAGDFRRLKHLQARGSEQHGADTEQGSSNDIKNTKDGDDADSGYGGDDEDDEVE